MQQAFSKRDKIIPESSAIVYIKKSITLKAAIFLLEYDARMILFLQFKIRRYYEIHNFDIMLSLFSGGFIGSLYKCNARSI
jgi:hypothetical protein